mgnify:FL=1
MTHLPDIVLYPHPALAKAAMPRPVDDEMRSVGAALLDVARSVSAYGLAAAHIGRNEPLVVVSFGPLETRDYRLLFNPEIVAIDGENSSGAEGSVSLPGIEVDVARPTGVRLRYDNGHGDGDGESTELALTGFASRVAQHEIDQMNGIFFLDKLSRLKRDAALRRYGKRARLGNLSGQGG